jgi:hypothetical protein
MGIWDAFSDIVEAVTPWSVVEAEAPAETQQVRYTTFFPLLPAVAGSTVEGAMMPGLAGLWRGFLG